jgi:hypothetical protein
MLIDFHLGQGSIVLRVKVRRLDTSQGLTGLTFSSSGLRIAAIADNEATTVAYTAAGSTIETISTLGVYAAPTATKCRFKEVDATSHPGVYEVQLADTRFGVAGAKSLHITLSGVTNMAECDAIVPLRAVDPYDSAAFGMSRLDAAISTRSTYAGGAVASVAGNVGGNVLGTVVGTVGGVASTVTVGGYGAGQDPATLVLDAAASGHLTAGTIGAKISSAASAGDPWTTDVVAGAYTGTQAGALMKGWSYYGVTVAVADSAPTATSFKLGSGASSVDGAYTNQFFSFESGALIGQRRQITGYTGATKTVTFSAGFTAAPANGDLAVVV